MGNTQSSNENHVKLPKNDKYIPRIHNRSDIPIKKRVLMLIKEKYL